MCGKFRGIGLLIALMTFLFGVAVAGFFTKVDPTVPYDINIRTCVPLDDIKTPKDGPGTDVYRARKKRIEEIDQELAELNNPPRPTYYKGEAVWACGTSRLNSFENLRRERRLMVDLIEAADGTKLVHREVCYEN